MLGNGVTLSSAADNILFVLNTIEVAWAAGFFDGEGTIGAQVNGGKGRRAYVALQVQIVNNDLEIITWFRDNFFPTTSVVAKKNEIQNAYAVQSGNSAALREFFAAVRPYVRLKGLQIDLGLQLLDAQAARDTELCWALRDAIREAKGPHVSGPRPKPRSYWDA